MPSNVVSEFDSVILKKDTNSKIFKVFKNKNISFCKEKFQLNNLIGQTYGSCFKISQGQLVKLSHDELLALAEKSVAGKEDDNDITADDSDDAKKIGKDNRDLIDRRENQKLTKEEIQKLRKEGVTGNEIVEHLIENSSTFAEKTEYSKQKYIKKKAKKHVSILTLLESNTRNLLGMYYSRGPTKICNLRMDSLGQILTYANVRAGGRYLVVDNCSGLVLGSMIERMNGRGVVINMYSGSASSRPAIDLGYNFSEEQKKVLHEFPLDKVASLDDNEKGANGEAVSMETDDSITKAPGDADNDECSDAEEESGGEDGDEEDGRSKDIDTKANSTNKKRKRPMDKDERDKRRAAKRKRTSEAKLLIQQKDLDGLIVASKFHPTPVVLSLIKFLMPSRPVIVFSPYSEPLLDCYSNLRDKGDVLLLKLSETWLRSFQILPERCHPHVNMSGSGGFLLTGLTTDKE